MAPPIDGGGVPPPVPNEGGRAEFNAGGLSDMASGSALEALNAEAAGNTAGGAPGLYRGGMVTRNRLSGPDPDGPDDGFAPLKIGEGVLTAAAMRHYGKGIVGRLNKLSVSKSALR